MEPGGSGWNDPPKLKYEFHSETRSRRNLLNKRVAYLNCPQTTKQDNTCLDPNMPPPTATLNKFEEKCSPDPVKSKTKETLSATLPNNMLVPNFQPSNTDKSDKNPVLKHIDLQCDFDFIEKLQEITSKLMVSDRAEIAKKIEILKSSLDCNNLSGEVVHRLRTLTQHLCYGNIQKAANLQTSLACDYISEVTTWISGIKRLIHHCDNRTDLL